MTDTTINRSLVYMLERVLDAAKHGQIVSGYFAGTWADGFTVVRSDDEALAGTLCTGLGVYLPDLAFLTIPDEVLGEAASRFAEVWHREGQREALRAACQTEIYFDRNGRGEK